MSTGAFRDDKQLCDTGTHVLTTHLNALDMEGWVARLERLSGQPVGWGYRAGAAMVHTTGDTEKVLAAAEILHDDLNELHRRETARVAPMLEQHRPAMWILHV